MTGTHKTGELADASLVCQPTSLLLGVKESMLVSLRLAGVHDVSEVMFEGVHERKSFIGIVVPLTCPVSMDK